MPRFVLLVLVVTAAACGGDGGTTPPPPPVSVTVSPSTATVNPATTAEFTVTVTNATNRAVNWTASAGTIAGTATGATWTAPVAGGSYTITATSVADPTKSGSATVTVNPVGITITPAVTTIGAGDTLTVNASITGTSNQGVTWTASAGSIVGTGTAVRWAAPVGGGSYTITAASVLDPTRTASTTIAVTPVTVTVASAATALFRGEGTTLTATVGGTTGLAVTWSATCGTIAGSGDRVQYTAPDASGVCTVRATSVRDTARSASAALTVRPSWRIGALDDSDDGACTFAHCSLREALTAANATPSRDSLIFAVSAPTTIALERGLPVITAPVDIVGPGAATLVIDGGAPASGTRNLLTFEGAFTASARGLTVRGGRRPAGGGVVVDNQADVTLRDLRIRDNLSVEAPGGGVHIQRGGRLTLIDTEVRGNRASGANGLGGGINVGTGSQLTMTNGRIVGNESTAGGGGLRVNDAAATLTGVAIDSNRAPSASNGVGGGVLTENTSAVLQLTNVTIAENNAGVGGGGLSLRSGATATISGTTLRGNRAPAGAGIEVFNAAATLVNATITGNLATGRGAGVLLFGIARYTQQGGTVLENVAGGSGGGIALQDDAELTLTDVALTANRVEGQNNVGGAIQASGNTRVRLSGGTVLRNRASGAGGGVVISGGRPATVTRVSVDSNTAIAAAAFLISANANVTITEGRIRGNVATTLGGGGIYAENSTVTVDGTTLTGNSAANGSGGGVLMALGGSYVLRNLTVEDNSASNGGGLGFTGTLTVSVEGGVLRRNQATTVGGGLWKTGQSALTMVGTLVLDNTAGGQGGGLQLVGPGAPATLRRLLVRGNRATTASGGGATLGVAATIEESTFANNTTGAIGGGVFSAATGNAVIRNSTFSANTAIGGGGFASTGPATLLNVTLFANRATDFGGGVGINNAGNVSMSNVLLADNRVGENPNNCGRSTGSSIPFTSTGGNISSDGSCPAFARLTDKVNTPAGLDSTLRDNGGPTPTHALLAGSAAINGGVAGCPSTDQRGAPRVGTCDVGAVEFGATVPAPIPQAIKRR